MRKEATFIFEVKRLEPCMKKEISQALEEMLLQNVHGIFRTLKSGGIHRQASAWASRMIQQSDLEFRQCKGTKALQFFESEIRLSNDIVFYYPQVNTIVHTLRLIVLAVGEHTVVFERDASIQGTPAALLNFLKEKTGLTIICPKGGFEC